MAGTKTTEMEKAFKSSLSPKYMYIKKKFYYIKTFLIYYSVNIPKSLMVYITPQPSSEPWRILQNPLLAKVYIVYGV